MATSPDASLSASGPLFVGGVPRSGTHALANLIGRHSRYAVIPRELDFHTGATGEVGLRELLEGRIGLSEFANVMSGHWWRRTAHWDSTITRGLHKTIPEDRFRRCLELFVEAYPSDATGATRAFIRGLLDPIAAEAGKPAWIVTDPANVVVAPLLYEIFPDMRLIQIMRDGRDVALSMSDLPWGRGSSIGAAVWTWQRTMREGHRGVEVLPAERVLTIQLEDLVAVRREETYAAILAHLELEDEPQMRAFFDERISSQSAHVGRWRTSLSPARRLAITAVYAGALVRLAAAGVSPRPPLLGIDRAHCAVDLTRRPQREAVDPWADGVAKDA